MLRNPRMVLVSSLLVTALTLLLGVALARQAERHATASLSGPNSRGGSPASDKDSADGARKGATGDNALASGLEALIDRNYTGAIKALKVASEEKGEQQDYALLLLGNAHFYAKEYEPAIETYNRLLKDFPKSSWVKKATFRKADCYLALRMFDRAAALYEPEMLRLVSNERREEIASAYLRHADNYFNPPKKPGVAPSEQPKPNYERARNLYEKALEIGLTREKEEGARLFSARCLLELKKFEETQQDLERLLRDYPKGKQVEAVKYHLGLAYLRNGDPYETRKIFRDFQEDYPKSDLLPDVAFTIAESYGIPSPQEDRGLNLGVKALRDFLKAFPKSQKAEKAEYYLGLSFYNRGRYDDASRELQSFLKARTGKSSEEIAQAKQQLGACYLRQKKYDEAIAAWRVFLADHPNHRDWERVQRQSIDASYAVGEDAYKAKKYDAARTAWIQFQTRYPIDQRNADIMFRLGMMLHEEKKHAEAIAEWEKVVSKYPEGEPASRAQFMVGLTLESKLDRFEDALEAYGKVTGQWQQQAQQRAAAMRQRKMVVYTERTFSTADKPVLKVITRNVPEVALRAYRVDMNDYFDRLHTVTGVDQLDLALIEPDQKWNTKVPDYRKLKEHETSVALPFKDPGVYAVTCGALAEAEEGASASPVPALEATSVVLITDLGIITKATRRDLLVFAENQKTKKPWAGAQVLISDGSKLLQQGKTDERGIYHWQPPEESEGKATPPLRNAQDLRILLASDGHYASTEGPIQDLRFVPGLTPRAMIYTDRPVYRAGQVVRLKGIVRKVDKGTTHFTPGDPYDLQVADPNGVVIRRQKVALGDFGTFSDSLALHPDSPMGEYRVQLTQGPASSPTFSAASTFPVLEYELQKLQLKVETEKEVYLRGEVIKGKIIGKYYYGQPLSKRVIHFGWDDKDIGQHQQTDDSGIIQFTIPTRKFEEEEIVTVWARIEDEGVEAESVVRVALVALRAELKLLRDVYLVGEKFTVQVEAKDLAGKPAGATFELKALKRDPEDRGSFDKYPGLCTEAELGTRLRYCCPVPLPTAGLAAKARPCGNRDQPGLPGRLARWENQALPQPSNRSIRLFGTCWATSPMSSAGSFNRLASS